MSLGEKAQLFVRDDYGFGDIWAGWNLPPDSALDIECSLSEIDGKGSRWFFIKRTVMSPVVKFARCWRYFILTWQDKTGCMCHEACLCSCILTDGSHKVSMRARAQCLDRDMSVRARVRDPSVAVQPMTTVTTTWAVSGLKTRNQRKGTN